jgi:hypothetical protein
VERSALAAGGPTCNVLHFFGRQFTRARAVQDSVGQVFRHDVLLFNELSISVADYGHASSLRRIVLWRNDFNGIFMIAFPKREASGNL